MEQTLLLQVKNLERFIQKHGEDMFFAKTISKMLACKLDKYEENIKRLDKYLRKFEHSYKKDSATFLKEFNKGMLGDDMAFIEWASVYQMRNRIEKKKSALENLIRRLKVMWKIYYMTSPLVLPYLLLKYIERCLPVKDEE